ncbi:MAG: aminoacyl-histidine dipeptidase [Endozoicomonas sp. (ex Botrylloides leachii)]|nr:aminoacyl-histidine dipeptidase [Endozoicomonas sp. (ex Botrylloides leachii)]
MSCFKNIQPEILWRHFGDLCAISRPSGYEQAVCAHIKQFGERLRLKTIIDEVGNIIISKPATQGMENRKGIVMQGHVDMVPQKNADTVHDFTKDPIKAYIDGEWVTAKGTTLGADNGIGVAAAMAILESKDIAHGPLEVLFTIDEESGMTGAKGLRDNVLQGEILLNMDSEEEGTLCIGCAGGVDVVVKGGYLPVKANPAYKTYLLAIRGLKGGHSGIDIILQRANANKLMIRLLKALMPMGVELASLNGGSLRNAIPREAFATLTIADNYMDEIAGIIDAHLDIFRSEFADVEPDLSITLSVVNQKVATVMPSAEISRWLDALHVSPNGVYRMSLNVEGVVETSNNLAIIAIADGSIKIENMLRSLIDSAKEEHAEMIKGLYRLLDAEVELKGSYPGWRPNRSSEIMKTMIKTHKELFGSEPEVEVIHAGLECGLLGSTYPHWDMISFGPTIRCAHSPDEKVRISSVENFWKYLLATLKNAPQVSR